MRKLISIVAVLLTLLCAGLASWPYFKQYRSQQAQEHEIEAIAHERLLLIAYMRWLSGEGGDPSASLLLYIKDLKVIGRWDKDAWTRLNAHAELRLAYGRLALIARKSGNVKAYSRYMDLAQKASRHYESILAGYGGASYVFGTQEEFVGFIEQMDAVSLHLLKEVVARLQAGEAQPLAEVGTPQPEPIVE